MNIQALDVRRVNNQTLKAFCRLQIEDFGMVINDVKLFVKGENHWAQMPNKVYESNGEKKYFPYIQFTNKDIEKEILKTAADLMLKELEVGEMGAQYAV
jgi:DNA-binding cell septation regulator SpoVG